VSRDPESVARLNERAFDDAVYWFTEHVIVGNFDEADVWAEWAFIYAEGASRAYRHDAEEAEP
jgi:hypothetical protein